MAFVVKTKNTFIVAELPNSNKGLFPYHTDGKIDYGPEDDDPGYEGKADDSDDGNMLNSCWNAQYADVLLEDNSTCTSEEAGPVGEKGHPDAVFALAAVPELAVDVQDSSGSACTWEAAAEGAAGFPWACPQPHAPVHAVPGMQGHAQDLSQGWPLPDPHSYLLAVHALHAAAGGTAAPWHPAPPSPWPSPYVAGGASWAAWAGAAEAAAEPEWPGGEAGGAGDILSDEEAGRLQATTVMVRNLPQSLTHAQLTGLLDQRGLHARYDFCYLPLEFERQRGLGYAFVNFLAHDDALHAMRSLNGFADWESDGGDKICEVCWGTATYQGRDANVARYRNSSLMHPDVHERFRPVLYEGGRRVDFPAPTKRVRKPRPRHPA